MMLFNREDGTLMRDDLREQLPQEFLLDVREAFKAAAEESHTTIGKKRYRPEDKASALGQERHFQTARYFEDVLRKHGAVKKIPAADRIVTGRVNNVLLTFVKGSKNQKPRFSKQRTALAQYNKPLALWNQSEFFETPSIMERLTVWFEVRYESDGPYPSGIQVIVPHSDGRGNLFKIGLEELLSKYEAGHAPQPDNALPRLKEAVARQQKQSE